MEFLLVGIGCLIVGIVFTYLILRPKLIAVQQKDKTIEQINLELQETHKKLLEDKSEIEKTLKEINKVVIKKSEEKALLDGQIDAIVRNIEDMKIQAEKSADIFYTDAMEIMQNKLSEQAEKMAINYQEQEEKYKTDYLETMQTLSIEMAKKLKQKNEEIAAASFQLQELVEKVQAAIAANIREEEKKTKQYFYTIGLMEQDIKEVLKLREIIPYLRIARPVNKIIWEAYYRNATTDLISRVVGAGVHTGIYRITNLLDNKIYIGQAVNIAERFKQHIKCGLGIDAPVNKLYIAMQKDGVENFSFEIIEECKQSDLNKKEKYWIEYYESQRYGYNMSSGGSRGN